MGTLEIHGVKNITREFCSVPDLDCIMRSRRTPIDFSSACYLVNQWPSKLYYERLESLSVNWVRLPILLVVGLLGKITSTHCPLAPESLYSRIRFGRLVSRGPGHLPPTQAYKKDSHVSLSLSIRTVAPPSVKITYRYIIDVIV